jgi:hypothetical protein
MPETCNEVKMFRMGLTSRAVLRAVLSLGCAIGVFCVPRPAAAQGQRTVEDQPQPLPPPGDPRRRRDEIKAVEGLLPRSADRGAALFMLAEHYARLGDLPKALALLKQCVDLDQGFDPADVPAFAPLKNQPGFAALVDRARRRFPPTHQAHVAFTIAQPDLFPEGLAVDGSRRVFYMGSMHHNKIVEITEAGEVSDFVKEGAYDLMPVGGVHVEPADHSVWCATDPGEKNRSEIVHFNTQGQLLEHYPAPGAGPHDLNDLVLRGAGEIYTTDTFANQVFRFDRKSHAFTALDLSTGRRGRPVFYPNGITLSDDGSVLYIADLLGILRLDLRTDEIQEVRPAAHDTLAGVDGLYWYKGSLVGVQYGTGARRVMRWTLSPEGRDVTASRTLERGTDLVKDPTTGAILDGMFYFMANTGIDNLNEDDGKVVDPAKLEPLHIAVVPLN